ncbi:hypothetical protein HN695_00235 [Candidatus Woesearchaeota archaeon]|jgi:hypothetical protein|nr:hypothetical protein [Candidatus Woesearchaeota archaeon]MBT5272552.1 hypothetical protein [Candidatus Woesearchaeota archaeon]MBT6041299.1 hypothetical protein [Candidatus Woesearchaeota archaeon]MBT6337104.1 hypothetical protein [Candidatus Woesearchaeota archaeon]MBT7926741.1 hypothetical protein [Candidatus Woesearchaeota archaeon]
MIVLIVSFPIYVSDVYAVNIETVEIKGNNNIPGYINPNLDVMSIIATLSEPISQQDAVLYDSDNGFFQSTELPFTSESCEGNVCYLTKEISNKQMAKFTATLKVNLPGQSAEKKASFCADGQGPKVLIKDWGQVKNELIVIFAADDTKTAPAGCAGLPLKEAALYIDNEVVQVRKITNQKSSIENSFTYDIVALGEKYQKFRVCVKVTDVLGNEGISCKKDDIRFDFTNPEFDDYLYVFDEEGNLMTHIVGGEEFVVKNEDAEDEEDEIIKMKDLMLGFTKIKSDFIPWKVSYQKLRNEDKDTIIFYLPTASPPKKIDDMGEMTGMFENQQKYLDFTIPKFVSSD